MHISEQSISWHFHIDEYQCANEKEMPFPFYACQLCFLHEVKQEQGYRAVKRAGHVEKNIVLVKENFKGKSFFCEAFKN